MATDFAEKFPEAREVFEAADEAFGGPLSRWIAEGPDEKLRLTEITQPAILTASIAMYRVLESRLPGQARPAFFAGHSLGEYSALVAAGSLNFSDAVALVRQRGAFMQEAVPEGEGAMLAVLGLERDEVERECALVGSIVAPANYNSPVQTVIAGQAVAVEQAAELLKAAGAKRLIPLEVSAPFHCELMAPAMENLASVLGDTPFANASAPVISNVTARPYQEGGVARERLREQVCAPVRWVESVERLVSDGATLQLEVGPGKVLSGLSAKIDRSLKRANLSQVDELERVLEAVSVMAAGEDRS
jgi:[acyl-carrier-protein] S-malonyltransferase